MGCYLPIYYQLTISTMQESKLESDEWNAQSHLTSRTHQTAKTNKQKLTQIANWWWNASCHLIIIWLCIKNARIDIRLLGTTDVYHQTATTNKQKLIGKTWNLLGKVGTYLNWHYSIYIGTFRSFPGLWGLFESIRSFLIPSQYFNIYGISHILVVLFEPHWNL